VFALALIWADTLVCPYDFTLILRQSFDKITTNGFSVGARHAVPKLD